MRKISEFPGLTTLNNTDEIIVSSGGVTYRIQLRYIKSLPSPYIMRGVIDPTIDATAVQYLDGGSPDPLLGGPFWVLAQGGTFSGTGDIYGNSWTFTAIDMRERSPIGAGSAAGLTTRTFGTPGGSSVAVLSDASQNPSHNHGISTGPYVESPVPSQTYTGYAEPAASVWAQATILSSGSGASHPNIHPCFCSNYMVRTPRVQ